MVSWERQAPPRIAGMLASLLEHRTELALDLTAAMLKETPYLSADAGVTPEDIGAEELLASIFGRLIEGRAFDLAVPRRVGRERAAAGVPLDLVMDAYRVGAAHIWRVVADAVLAAGIPAAELVAVTDQLWEAQGAFTYAMSESYRAETTARLLIQQSERAALVDALLTGRLVSRSTLWEIAELLRLPARGPFVVVAAEPKAIGRSALPGVESTLRGTGLTSAWQLLPDLEAGIAYVTAPRHRQQLLDVLAGYPDRRIGISPPYSELANTARALRFARMALETAAVSGEVVEFDDAPLAVAAVASPDVMHRIAGTVLASLDSMRDEDRAILLDTFDVWVQNRGSADAAAGVMFCHPNTVRQRLRRLEDRTGRSLSDPRELTELCLAIEARRRTPALGDT